MAKQIVFLLCALLALANADLVDEVLEQIHQLEGTVEGVILAAHANLGNLMSEFLTNSNNVGQTGTINIQQEHEAINAELTSIKDLATEANVDHYPCTNMREQDLERLPNTYIDQLNLCRTQMNGEATIITGDARYRVDVVINKVHDLENRVRRCNAQLECVSQLVSEIELDKIRLPQNIVTEVQATQSFLQTLRLSVQACSNDAVSEYVAEANSILVDIEDCINRLLGGR